VRIDALLAAGFTRSFEFFPPKTDDESRVLEHTLLDLRALDPSFVSVTYRGGPASRQRTFDLVNRVQRESDLVAMAHLICVGHSIAELREILENYQANHVVNLMALGGDRPEDPTEHHGELEYASELVELAREIGGFSIGVAAHPLTHPRSRDRALDRHFLARKLEHADFAVTQFFFEAMEWTQLVDEVRALGVDKPILPGVVPVTSIAGIPRMGQMGAAVPHWLVERLELANESGGPQAVRAEGIAAASDLCQELIELGAPGLHFYTMNRSTATREIHERLFGRPGAD
jgi:methylenetetrahydrofolate reductase (NADPH)